MPPSKQSTKNIVGKNTKSTKDRVTTETAQRHGSNTPERDSRYPAGGTKPDPTSYWVVPVIRELTVDGYPNLECDFSGGAIGVLMVYPTREAAVKDNPGYEHLIMEMQTAGSPDERFCIECGNYVTNCICE